MPEIYVNEFIKGLLIFLRINGVLFSAPIYSNKSMPNSLKLFFALMITYLVFFTVDDMNYNPDTGLIPLAIFGVKEVITGFLIGFTINFVFYGISYAGMLIGFDMGLAMARIFDPTTETDSNMVGQFILILTTFVFFIINGHHYVITAVAYSFKIVPLGLFTINQPVMDIIIKFSGGIFVLAVKIASPIMISFFLMHVGAGIIARTIPSMNVFFVLQPLKIGLGFVILIAVTPVYVYIIRNLLMNYESKLFQLVKYMSY